MSRSRSSVSSASFGRSGDSESLLAVPFVTLFHSSHAVTVRQTSVSAETVARALWARAQAGGNLYNIVSKVAVYSLHDCGMVVVAVNRSMAYAEVTLSVSGENITSTRGAMHSVDTVAPGSFQVLAVVSQAIGGMSYSFSTKFSCQTTLMPFVGALLQSRAAASASKHRPPIAVQSLHAVYTL
eukprot:m.1529512 g.1529512  ORF g.1529512 m.1529512 type:complete len:183 (+) comp25238_c1_seq51:1047-1595(+)